MMWLFFGRETLLSVVLSADIFVENFIDCKHFDFWIAGFRS
jgi:hypothetical protein